MVVRAIVISAALFSISGCVGYSGVPKKNSVFETTEATTNDGGSHEKIERFREPLAEEEEERVKFLVKQRLKDPESAKFKDIFLSVPDSDELNSSTCGQVNAKNSFGGYNGYKWFFMVGDEPNFWEVNPKYNYSVNNDMIKLLCIRAK
ncbi:hypothetical protein [Halomonas alimentaria]|uniref:Lipoprotein n=1 Tax=Halomonas alimentaria TaxID=147248 RepID=A0A7X5AQ29_9GAMM|nr:hypothetical protein [Halomonas alimentaria]NAW35014.1 hypothetical protein [Halomonas alimentaria]